ncbi:MAG TPA: hypothetical protein DCM28_17125 [Phycisphaerales bacterium]|nr:hypothetical protein [Phycisphaerales bacterium]HCD33384.1 hypothetical protein [Phycisphaerales bacterium]
MNQHQNIEHLWDAYRDGDITAEDKALFEQYLADHPDEQALFDAETQWLDSLHDQPVTSSAPMLSIAQTQPANRAFAAAVLDHWDDASRPVLAKIHWKSAAFSAGWLVAAAAIAIAMWVNAPDATLPNNDAGPQIAHRPQPRSHPLTSLVQDMDRTYDEQPTNVFAAFGSMMSLSNVEVTPIQPASYQER